MSLDLTHLLEQAFFVDDARTGSIAIERALEAYEQQMRIGSRLFEVVAPDEPDETWLRDRLIAPLVYFCESAGDPIPACSGVVVALYQGEKLYGIAAERVVRWGSAELQLSVGELRNQYGTHERDTGMRT